MEALVVLFHIVKHRLHVCVELVAGQRGVGELWVLVRDLSELVLQCAEQLAGFGPRLRGVVALQARDVAAQVRGADTRLPARDGLR